MSPSTFIQRKSKGTLNIMSHGCHIKNFHFCARQAHHPAQGFGRSILNASSGWLFPYPESGRWWEVDHVWENSQEVLGASFYLACACILKIIHELIVSNTCFLGGLIEKPCRYSNSWDSGRLKVFVSSACCDTRD